MTKSLRSRLSPLRGPNLAGYFLILASAVFVVGVYRVGYRDASQASQKRFSEMEAGFASETEAAVQHAEMLSDEVLVLEAELASATATLEAVQEDYDALLQADRDASEKPQKAIQRPLSSRQGGSGWKSAKASWYGSQFYGNRVADPDVKEPYGPKSWGVAHKTLPFGTRIQIEYGGESVTVPVFDRGPYTAGREFDLSYAVAQSLGFSGVQTIRWRVLR